MQYTMRKAPVSPSCLACLLFRGFVRINNVSWTCTLLLLTKARLSAFLTRGILNHAKSSMLGSIQLWLPPKATPPILGTNRRMARVALGVSNLGSCRKMDGRAYTHHYPAGSVLLLSCSPTLCQAISATMRQSYLIPLARVLSPADTRGGSAAHKRRGRSGGIARAHRSASLECFKSDSCKKPDWWVQLLRNLAQRSWTSHAFSIGFGDLSTA